MKSVTHVAGLKCYPCPRLHTGASRAASAPPSRLVGEGWGGGYLRAHVGWRGGYMRARKLALLARSACGADHEVVVGRLGDLEPLVLQVEELGVRVVDLLEVRVLAADLGPQLLRRLVARVQDLGRERPQLGA